MPDQNWRASEPGAAAAAQIIGRLDAIGALMDEGSYDEALAAAYGRRWLSDLDIQQVPSHALRRAQVQIDSVCVALKSGNLHFARESLAGARRAISG